jgi:hypothetical protein
MSYRFMKCEVVLPSYVSCTMGIFHLFAYACAFFLSLAATAAMMTSAWDRAGMIKAVGLLRH